jgi:hypothetical protein
LGIKPPEPEKQPAQDNSPPKEVGVQKIALPGHANLIMGRDTSASSMTWVGDTDSSSLVSWNFVPDGHIVEDHHVHEINDLRRYIQTLQEQVARIVWENAQRRHEFIKFGAVIIGIFSWNIYWISY